MIFFLLLKNLNHLSRHSITLQSLKQTVICAFMLFRLDVLGMHEFDSVRKRMSVVIRFPDNSVKVLVKGADISMSSILAEDSERDNHVRHTTQRHLTEYSVEGLRTLVVAARDLTEAELELWQYRFDDASTSLTDRATKLRQTSAIWIIETSLAPNKMSKVRSK